MYVYIYLLIPGHHVQSKLDSLVNSEHRVQLVANTQSIQYLILKLITTIVVDNSLGNGLIM